MRNRKTEAGAGESAALPREKEKALDQQRYGGEERDKERKKK